MAQTQVEPWVCATVRLQRAAGRVAVVRTTVWGGATSFLRRSRSGGALGRWRPPGTAFRQRRWRGADDELLAIPRDDDLLEAVEVNSRPLPFARGSRALESSEVNRVPRHPRPTATLRAAELRCDLRDLVSATSGSVR